MVIVNPTPNLCLASQSLGNFKVLLLFTLKNRYC